MSTSRVQPIAIGGQMVLAGSDVASGGADSTLTVSALNLASDSIYLVDIVIKNASGTAKDIALVINGDTTAADYYRQLHYVDGATATPVRQNNNLLYGGLAAAHNLMFTGHLKQDLDLYPRLNFLNNNSPASSMSIDHAAIIRNVAANLTSIAVSTTGVFTDGSYIKVYKMSAAATQIPHVVNGRLTLESGVPISTTDQTAKTTIYFTPFRGNQVGLWNGSAWSNYTFSEVSLALGTLTSGQCYDVFGYISGSTIALEMLAWTNSTTRATAVTLQDGRYCKSGDKTRLYLGTFYTTSTTTTEDSIGRQTSQVGGKRFLWNYYNRVPRELGVIDTTTYWTYNTATIRQAQATAGNKVEFIVGIQEDVIDATLFAGWYAASVGAAGAAGIGLDSTTTFTGYVAPVYCTVTATEASGVAAIKRTLAVGYHYLAWLEKGCGTGTTIFLGNQNGAGSDQSGLSAVIQC